MRRAAWFVFTVNGVAPIGRRAKPNQQTHQALISMPRAMMRLIVLAVHMTWTARREVAHGVEMTNSSPLQ
jgi:hypothetical protein